MLGNGGIGHGRNEQYNTIVDSKGKRSALKLSVCVLLSVQHTSSSALRRLNTYLRSTQSEDRLAAAALIHACELCHTC